MSMNLANTRTRRDARARLRGCVAALLPAVLGPMPAAADAAAYATEGTCADFPMIALTVPAGWCLAHVADSRSGLVFPRRVVEVSPGRFWLVDMGGWEPGRGRLLEFELPARGGAPSAPTMKVIADKLDRPHGLALGPDGRVYVGEAGRVWRTGPTLPVVIDPV